MVKKLLLATVFLVSVNTFAQQERNWNVESNFSLIPANGLGQSDIVIDLGIKYKFLNTDLLSLGLGMNVGYLTDNTSFSMANSDDNIFIFQPRLFTEFNLPFSDKLRPSLGVGYSYLSGISFTPDAAHGFNFNFGIIYDISDKWFIQAQYDFIDLKSINSGEGYNTIRIGVGFKF
ncbi:outer membrane beta-barrel protein [Croceitalea marina]|uniref:Outer membrane beta-barrel protein n=1 Tax=Croceitalea marina TaxID=1775166 RepID=A0ABW5N1L6_9FLAO